MRMAGERSGQQGGNPLETDSEYGRERQGGGGGNSRSEHTINARTRAGNCWAVFMSFSRLSGIASRRQNER